MDINTIESQSQFAIKSGKRSRTPYRCPNCSSRYPALLMLLECVLKFLYIIYPPTFYIRLHIRNWKNKRHLRKFTKEVTNNAAKNMAFVIDQGILDELQREVKLIPPDHNVNAMGYAKMGMLYGYKVFKNDNPYIHRVPTS